MNGAAPVIVSDPFANPSFQRAGLRRQYYKVVAAL
jgi:hypothetical protein